MIRPNETLGQVAAAHPAATQVFLRRRLDFCCGGGQKLEDACRKAGIDPYSVIQEIVAEGATRDPVRWDTRPLLDLIEFILIHYHQPLRRDLRVLSEAARKVERVHGRKASCPLGLASLLEQLELELNEHMDKEEQVLFPAIQSGAGIRLQMPIRVMMQEHDDHGATLRLVRERAADFQAPPEACATWRALYGGLAKLESDLMEHIHLENNVLFPRVLNA